MDPGLTGTRLLLYCYSSPHLPSAELNACIYLWTALQLFFIVFPENTKQFSQPHKVLQIYRQKRTNNLKLHWKKLLCYTKGHLMVDCPLSSIGDEMRFWSSWINRSWLQKKSWLEGGEVAHVEFGQSLTWDLLQWEVLKISSYGLHLNLWFQDFAVTRVWVASWTFLYGGQPSTGSEYQPTCIPDSP